MNQPIKGITLCVLGFCLGIIVAPNKVITYDTPIDRIDYDFAESDETLISATYNRCEIFMTDRVARTNYILEYVAKEQRRELTAFDKALYANLAASRCLGYYEGVE
tara:strand:- start:2643 stop:2960 length:318 start_codon:yes stop_codon:yes gene_type:complete